MAIGGIKTPWKLARSGIKDHLKPVNSPRHRAFVTRQPCVAKGPECTPGKPQFAHFKGFKDAGTQQKGGDERGFPCCFHHHICVQHQIGEKAFQERYKIDLFKITLDLARRSPDPRIRERVNG